MDITKEKKKGLIEFVGRTRVNNGIKGYVNELNIKPNPKNIISVSQIGTIVAQIRKQEWYASQNIFSLKAKNDESNLISLYGVTAINKSLKNSFSDGYGNYPTLAKLIKIIIKLPVKNNKPDFEFMDSFIADIEAERMSKLNSYLVATGLKDYTLTAKEQKALIDFEQAEFKEFKVTDIFDVNNSKSILSRDIIADSGTTPYLCASADNNAVSTYIAYDKQHIDTGNCVFIGGKTFVVTYQEHDFYSNDSHNLILHLKDAEKSKSNQLYLATCVKKGLAHKYSWGDSISNRKIQKDIISLPVQDDKPDYAIMDTLISAIQKLVIKDVVIYLTDKAQSSPMYLNESTNSLEASEL